MLNYISAELYKLRRHKGLWIISVILLALESWMLCPSVWVFDVRINREALYSVLAVCLFLGMFLSPVFAAAVFDDQHGHATLKNEVVFGITRRRIYLGKLLAAALAGTAVAAVMVGWFLLLSCIISTPAYPEQTWELLRALSKAVLCHYLMWLSVLSLAFFCLMTLKSAVGGVIVTYLVVLFWTPVSIIGAGKGAALWYRLAADLFFAAPLRYLMEGSGSLPNAVFQLAAENVAGYALLVNSLWIGGATALGLFFFHRQEIK